MNTSRSTPNTAPDSATGIALAAAFDSQGRILLLKRTVQQHCAGLWSFPGGKIEAGETAGQAASRELFEETALIGHDWRLLGSHRHHYDDRTLDFFLFRCHCPDSGTLQAETEYRWVLPDTLAELPMPAANRALIAMLETRA